jgi:hypothetical protein
MPIPMVTNAATAEMRTTASAISPRFTQPKSKTGVKYRPTIAAGATAGTTTCLTKVLMGGAPGLAVFGGGPSPPPGS